MIKLEEQPIETTEHYLFNTWIKGTEIVKTEKGDITVLEILNDFRSHLLQNIEHNKEAYYQKQCAIHDVSQAKRTVCPKCGDYGWIYNDDATSRKVCPCHY